MIDSFTTEKDIYLFYCCWHFVILTKRLHHFSKHTFEFYKLKLINLTKKLVDDLMLVHFVIYLW